LRPRKTDSVIPSKHCPPASTFSARIGDQQKERNSARAAAELTWKPALAQRGARSNWNHVVKKCTGSPTPEKHLPNGRVIRAAQPALNLAPDLARTVVEVTKLIRLHIHKGYCGGGRTTTFKGGRPEGSRKNSSAGGDSRHSRGVIGRNHRRDRGNIITQKEPMTGHAV